MGEETQRVRAMKSRLHAHNENIYCHNPTARKFMTFQLFFFFSVYDPLSQYSAISCSQLNYDTNPVYFYISAHPNILVWKCFSLVEVLPFGCAVWPLQEIYFNCVVYCGQGNIEL